MEKIVKSKNFVLEILSSLLGRKILVSFSGLFLISFITLHLLGNLTLLLGKDAFNLYAYTLSNNRAVLFALETVLVLGFAMHIILAALGTLSNYVARPQSYKQRKKLGMSTVFSSNMGLTGTVIFVFLIVHIREFRLGDAALIPLAGESGIMIRDLYTLVVADFKELPTLIFYIIAAILVGGHLSHGLQSAFKSIGLYNTRMKDGLKILAYVFGSAIASGFSFLALYLNIFA